MMQKEKRKQNCAIQLNWSVVYNVDNLTIFRFSKFGKNGEVIENKTYEYKSNDFKLGISEQPKDK